MSNEVAKTGGAALPDFLKDKAKTTSVGNIDQSDIIIPRIKLLQATSPEVTEIDGCKAGHFFHTISGEMLGNSFRIIPILIRKRFVLWAPRNDERGMLARSSDAKHWDDWQNEDGSPKVFVVRPKGSTVDVTYKLAPTVAESGLDRFGTSMPGDPNSSPAASLTYDILAMLPDLPELSPVLLLNTRSAVKKAKMLISKIEGRPVDHFAQIYKVNVKKEDKDGDAFYNYDYVGDGYVQDEGMYNAAKSLYEKMKDEKWAASDEAEDEETGAMPENGNTVERTKAGDIPF